MIKYYRKLKIQAKYTLAIILSVMIPFIILGSMFSNRLYDMVLADTIKEAQSDSAKISPLVDGVIDKITSISTGLSTSDYFMSTFYSASSEPLSTRATSDEVNEFSAKVSDLEERGFNVRAYLSIPEDNSIFSDGNFDGIFLPIAEAKGTYWYGIFQGQSIHNLFCPEKYLSQAEAKNLGDCAYITYFTTTVNSESYSCYLAVYYSSALYETVLSENLGNGSGVSYIINERQEIVATTDVALSATYRLKYDEITSSLMSSNNFVERDVLGNKVYVALYYVEKPQWFIVTVIPEAPLLDTTRHIMMEFMLIAILWVLLGVGLAIAQSRSITSRLSKVIAKMGEVRNGPPHPMEDSSKSEDEVGELISTYNYMALEMEQLIEREKRASENLRIAEFNALQAQINPHFLYNTMDMINWMAKEGRTEEVSEVVQNLSRFYKLTLSRKRSINVIADELEHVSIYVQLENMRRSDSIDLVIDMPDELTNHSIPKLTLQPIVENAIIHGIMEKDSKEGTIIITGWEEGDDILILISDDGVGIPSDKIDDILSEKPIGPTKGSNVAISNIHHRLRILYGPSYGLSYASTPGEGTEVTLRIPKLIG